MTRATQPREMDPPGAKRVKVCDSEHVGERGAGESAAATNLRTVPAFPDSEVRSINVVSL